MSNKKQIEDFGKVIDASPWKIEQDHTGCHINSKELAEYFINNGYCKTSDVVNEVLSALDDRIRKAWGARFMKMPPVEGYEWNDEFIAVKTIYKFINELKENYIDIDGN